MPFDRTHGRAGAETTRKEQHLSTTIDFLSAFLDEAEERGSVEEAELEAFALEHDLEPEEIRGELVARDVAVRHADDDDDEARAATST